MHLKSQTQHTTWFPLCTQNAHRVWMNHAVTQTSRVATMCLENFQSYYGTTGKHYRHHSQSCRCHKNVIHTHPHAMYHTL